MKKRRYVFFILLGLSFGSMLFVSAYAASSDRTVDTATWPMWPKPDARILNNEVWEPATFLSIGRDVIGWVNFGNRPSNDGIVSADFYVTIKTTSNSFDTKPPTATNGDSFYMVIDNATVLADDNSSILSGLNDHAVLPSRVQEWLSNGTETVPNQSFNNPSSFINDYKAFAVGSSTGFRYADSGHAPPQIVFETDPWLEAFLGNQYVPPPKWKDRVFGFLPTNQGTLQGFEIYPETPSSARSWLVVPYPAFLQAFYHQARRLYHDSYKRLTVLDGPVTIRDVEIGGGWKRILIGTTGIGTLQSLKPADAWVKVGESTFNPSSTIPSVSDEGRVFGVYGFDFTDMEETPSASTIKPLWSVTNRSFNTSARSGAFSDLLTMPGTTGYSAYAEMQYSVCKPLIGYTKEGTTRTWHAVILGVTKEGHYKWLDINPADGTVRRSGTFSRPGVTTDGPVSISWKEGNKTYTLSPEQAENLYPSRILAAFPRPEDGIQEPLLSSIYIYLENGSLYLWNLNDPNSTPTWVATMKCSDENPMAPLTDFDVSYVKNTATLENEAYFAANVTFSYGGSAGHDSQGLIVINVTKLLSLGEASRVFKKPPPGQAGASISSPESYFLQLQLQGSTGADKNVQRNIMASPVFILNKLYQAFYEKSGQGGNAINLTRLYTLDFGKYMGKGQKVELEKGTDYIDLTNQQAVTMLVDSTGNLVLLDASGNIVGEPIPTGLVYAGTGTGTGSSTFQTMKVVYWKTN